MESLTGIGPKISNKEVSAIISEIGTDENGMLDYQEIVEMICIS